MSYVKNIITSVIVFLCLSSVVSAVALEVESHSVNLGRHWFSNEQNYWGLSTNEFNVFTVTEQTTGDEDYVALFCPQAYIHHGTGLQRVAKMDNTNYTIYDAVVAADTHLWVATDTGVYQSRSKWGTGDVWINDTDYFLPIATGDFRRLRFDNDYVYAMTEGISIVAEFYAIDYTTLAPVNLWSRGGANYYLLDFYVVSGNLYELMRWSTDYRFYKNDNHVTTVIRSPGWDNKGGSLHVNTSEFAYFSAGNRGGNAAQYNDVVDLSTGTINDTWTQTSMDYCQGSCVYGTYSYEGLRSYWDSAEDKYYIHTFSTHFTQPLANYSEEEKEEFVEITGIVYDALNMTAMSGANISILQTSQYYNKTSNATGMYNITLFSDIPFYVNVTKTGYTHEDFSVTALWTGDYTMDLYLLPVQSGVYGLVVEYPWHQAINGSTVTLWNATYNDSTTSNLAGFYELSGMVDGYYDMNASATDYVTSSDENVSVTGGVGIQSFVLLGVYNLTVRAENSETAAPIASFMATIDTESQSTTTGSTVFPLGYGLYVVTVSATGYYSNAAYAYVNEDEAVTVSLVPVESSYYSPHYVRFVVVDIWGTEYSGVAVNVSYTQAGESQSMNATTGGDGAVGFSMSQSTRYTMQFTKASEGVNTTFIVYPVETEYYVYVDTFSFTPPDDDTVSSQVDWWWTQESINASTGWINFTYYDSNNETTFIEYWINDSNNSELYYFNTTYPGVWQVNQLVPANNITYLVRFNSNHPDFTEQITASHTIVFKGLQAPSGWTTQWMYTVVAICALIFIGLVFSAASAGVGGVMVVLSGWLFIWMGWLDGTAYSYGMMVLATVIAIGFVLRKSEDMG